MASNPPRRAVETDVRNEPASIERAANDPRKERMRKAAEALANPDVRPLIDARKLVRSAVFADIAQFAAELLMAHGDTAAAQRALSLVTGTKHEAALLQWFEARTGVKLAKSGDRLRIESRGAAPNPQASLASSFPAAAEARDDIEAQRATASKSKKLRVVRAKVSQDLMDSRLMLSGSFGHGKRR